MSDFTLPPFEYKTVSYKAIRAAEICDMARKFGLGDSCTLLIAHLLTECGSMSEYCDWQPGKHSSDNGWAVGIAQWHLFWRYNHWLKDNGFVFRPADPWYAETVRAKFFQDFPEMKDWRHQAEKYLAEIKEKRDTLGSVDKAIDTWNAKATYMSEVYANQWKAEKLLSL